MPAYLSIDLDDLEIDPALARRLPPGLAAYYLAAPLADEDGAISVAMAHPENETALAVLRVLLDAPVVPVRAPASVIRRALARQERAAPDGEPSILIWGSAPAMVEMARGAGALLARPWQARLTVLAPPEIDLAAALDVARAGNYCLTVMAAPQAQTALQLYRQVSTPFLLLRRPVEEWRRILVVLRGFMADCHTLAWLAPLLQQAGATVTLLPLPQTRPLQGQPPMALSALEKAHLQDCLRHPALQEIPAFIRFRQGPPGEQVIAEARQGGYDFLAIAAEGFGAFLTPILAALEESDGSQQSLFILKPPAAVRTVR